MPPNPRSLILVSIAACLLGTDMAESQDADLIDQMRELHNRILDSLADVLQYNSDISIRFSAVGDEIVHVRFAEDGVQVRYFRFDDTLGIQLLEFFEAGGFARGRGSIEFLEYHIPVVDCPRLGTSIADVTTALQQAVSNIGVRSTARELETVALDGIYYHFIARMNGPLVGRFSVGENDGPLFRALHSTMTSVRQCWMTAELEVRTKDF